jgi:hypothetical protein
MDTHRALLDVPLGQGRLGGDVVEIGSQRHMRDGSSIQLLALSERLGVGFNTVDFDEKTFEKASQMVGPRAHHGDGAEFLAAYPSPISILYLDNYDVIYSETHGASLASRVGDLYSSRGLSLDDSVQHNLNSAKVHFDQLLAGFDKLTDECIVAIDDTIWRPHHKFWWGKGALAIPYLLQATFRCVYRMKRGAIFARGLEELDVHYAEMDGAQPTA